MIQKHISIFCQKFKNEIENYCEQNRMNALLYNNLFLDNGRYIIFDCGYSGYVSFYLNSLIPGVYDKIYLVENKTNQRMNLKYGTTTYSIFGDNMMRFGGIFLVMEELLFPVSGRVIGFNSNVEPISKDENYSITMKKQIQNLQETCMVSAENFSLLVKDYMVFFREVKHIGKLIDSFNRVLRYISGEIKIFDDIIFPDDGLSEDYSLSDKLKQSFRKNPIPGTKFAAYLTKI